MNLAYNLHLSKKSVFLVHLNLENHVEKEMLRFLLTHCLGMEDADVSTSVISA